MTIKQHERVARAIRKKNIFLKKLSLFMSCLKYVTERAESPCNYLECIKKLSTLEQDRRVEYLKVKLYESLLIMSENNKNKIFYNDDPLSERIFAFYSANNRFFKNSLPQLKETAAKIRHGQLTNVS